MRKPSKQQIASVRSALKEIHVELLGWDPHVLVAFDSAAQKAQIIARMSQLGWHYVDDPSNETDTVSMAEFSIETISSQAVRSSPRSKSVTTRRVRFPAPFFASFGTLSALMGIFFAITFLYTDHRMRLLDESGVVTAGRVERIYFTSGKGGRIHYVSYRFADLRRVSHGGDDAYPFQDWGNLRPGDPISVSYLGDEPAKNNLTRRVRLIVNRDPKEAIIPIGISWIISGCFFLGYWLRKRSSKRDAGAPHPSTGSG